MNAHYLAQLAHAAAYMLDHRTGVDVPLRADAIQQLASVTVAYLGAIATGAGQDTLRLVLIAHVRAWAAAAGNDLSDEGFMTWNDHMYDVWHN